MVVFGYDVEAFVVMKIVHVCSAGCSWAEWRVVVSCKESRWHLDGSVGRNLGGGQMS